MQPGSSHGGRSKRAGRPFGLLRLTGVPLRVLRRVVAVETAAPLIVIALGSAIIGFVASDLFLRSQVGLTSRLPGVAYYAIVLGGLGGITDDHLLDLAAARSHHPTRRCPNGVGIERAPDGLVVVATPSAHHLRSPDEAPSRIAAHTDPESPMTLMRSGSRTTLRPRSGDSRVKP